MKKLLLFYLGFLVFCTTQVFAQDRTITGTVSGRSDGLPLPGVSVVVKGSSKGTQTDANGKFSIPVSSSARTLVFRYVGYTTQEVTIPESSKPLVIGLDVDSKQLGEVVVTGYSSVLKKNTTSSVAKITGDEVANLPVTSFDQSLGGKAAGVQVNIGSGIVGAPVNIRIRGVSSIASGSNPLIVVDGVPITQGDNGQLYNTANPLGDLNPNDIESLEVLKDASATALYGSRGAAGVIVITTKQGKAGVSKVTLDTYFGFNEPSKKIDVLNADQYISVINQKYKNAGLTKTGAAYFDINGDGTPDPVNTDWQNEVYSKGLTMNHQIAVTGGTQKTTVYASASYSDYQNYIDVNRARRGSVRLNITHQANNWLKVGINSQYSRNLQNGLGSGTGGALSGIPYGPFMYYPDVPVSINGNYYYGQGGNAAAVGTIPNPVAVLHQNYDNYDTKRFLGSGFAEVTLLPGLRIKSTYGADYQTGLDYQYWGNDIGDGKGLGGLVQDVYNETLVWNWANTINFNKTYGDHTINAVAGAEYNKVNTRFFYAAGIGASDPFYNQFVGSAFSTKDADGGLGANGFDSYFGSVNYAFKNKYLATATYRADAYSGFGISHRRGGFPSGALAWNFTEEDFVKNQNIVSNGKIRASYGLSGNSNIGNFPSLATYSPVQYATLGGSSLGNAGNTDLRWEKTKQLDIGADFTLFKKLNVVFDYYDKRTSDLLLNNPVPGTLGIPGNSIFQNIGAMYNRGLELSLTTDISAGKDFHWIPSFNIAYNKNQVTSTTGTNADIVPTTNINIIRPGYALGSYYLIRWAGVNPQTGLAQFLDANGNIKMYNPAGAKWTNPTTGAAVTAISAADRVLINKSYFPKYQGGFTNTFRYKQFDLSVLLQFAADFDVYDATMAGLHAQSMNNSSTDILNSWTTPGQNAPNQKLYYGDAVSGQQSTRWLEKGDFIRGKNINLGYTLPKSIASKLTLSSLRIYAQVQNAFTITGYKGTNPEAGFYTGNSGYTSQTGNIAGGIDSYTPYLARTWILGLNVAF
ncbi:SusC/RagA family TonB-linked outer membrane protein [Mucilaginibacter jinjuensis]|uniref:TonB-dependent receptor n=1 Tax=Mucilaginibacter jinjuensis TaxID=1176721 RepID=A0ABY7T856_9SPHI|nr:TonB-dependent receptor [Mucilaginibacter jinjuensis]WCT12433.1 TonB-dependent receptor [Mucilaginibacter jinjuensis]